MLAIFSSTRAATALGLFLVAVLYCIPLAANLGGLEMENDEAGYSYQVDRMLETGDWMTPRAVPTDVDFVEKPPLMFWLIAGGMKAGLLPHTDIGMRALSVAFGSLAFIYVYLIGCRLQGPVTGVAAGLVLFTFNPLIYDHGLRTNNMEGPLFLSYCAGMFHFMHWMDADARAKRRLHASMAIAAFVLGFMTKFVAAIFLPTVWVLAMLARPDRLVLVRTRWKDWLGPAAVAAVFVLPWFAFQTWRLGTRFWQILIGQHVYDRFTTGLDPTHLQPWSFYFTRVWGELASSGSLWIVLIGLGFLVFRAAAERDWRARLLLIWAVVPVVLMSMGSSKLIHYAYPFIPPLALGAGWIAGAAIAWLYLKAGCAEPLLRRVAGVIGAIALAVAAWTLVAGPLAITIGQVSILRNASVVRPLVLALVLFWLSGRFRASLGFAVAAMIVLLPLPLLAYERTADRARENNHPLRAIRDCVNTENVARGTLYRGVYVGSGPIPIHSYFFYLRQLGPFLFREDGLADDVGVRLFVPAQHSLVILSEQDYATWADRLRSGAVPGRVGGVPPPAVRTVLNYLVVMPGDYQVCVTPAISAGAGRFDGIIDR